MKKNEIKKCKRKTKALIIAAVFCMVLIAFPCLAGTIDTKVAETVGQWPAQTLLAALAMGAMWFAHKSWKVTMEVTEKQLEHQNKTNKIIMDLTLQLKRSNDMSNTTNKLLEKRPCIISQK